MANSELTPKQRAMRNISKAAQDIGRFGVLFGEDPKDMDDVDLAVLRFIMEENIKISKDLSSLSEVEILEAIHAGASPKSDIKVLS